MLPNNLFRILDPFSCITVCVQVLCTLMRCRPLSRDLTVPVCMQVLCTSMHCRTLCHGRQPNFLHVFLMRLLIVLLFLSFFTGEQGLVDEAQKALEEAEELKKVSTWIYLFLLSYFRIKLLRTVLFVWYNTRIYKIFNGILTE